jgi:hypothetical protein
MKENVLLLLLLISIPSVSQTGTDSAFLLSPKPGILINGNQCLIGNTIWSCIPKTCDSLIIPQGDTVQFCTGQQVFLNTDTAYYMEWNFAGSTNYPLMIHDGYPNNTPLCYTPQWNAPGDYVIDIYYNGWLSAYPTSDCYSFGPSHWITKITVLPSSSSIAENSQSGMNCTVSPNPASSSVHFQLNSNTPQMKCLRLFDQTGREILSTTSNSNEFELSTYNISPGLYFYHIEEDAEITASGKLIIE